MQYNRYLAADRVQSTSTTVVGTCSSTQRDLHQKYAIQQRYRGILHRRNEKYVGGGVAHTRPAFPVLFCLQVRKVRESLTEGPPAVLVVASPSGFTSRRRAVKYEESFPTDDMSQGVSHDHNTLAVQQSMPCYERSPDKDVVRAYPRACCCRSELELCAVLNSKHIPPQNIYCTVEVLKWSRVARLFGAGTFLRMFQIPNPRASNMPDWMRTL